MQQTKEINFTVTVDEANLILEGIGVLPFARVYQLVGKLQEQAKRQIQGDSSAPGPESPSVAPRA